MWEIVKWDPELKRGDLVRVDRTRVDSTGGLLLLATDDMHADYEYTEIPAAVFIEARLIDFGVDQEVCPVILHDGNIRIVIRGSVTRAE